MYVLGVDIGTTGTKAMLFGETGTCAGSSHREYPLVAIAGGGAEQDARDWWRTLAETVREATAGISDKREIKAISLSTQGGSCVLLDENDAPLISAHTWLDHRPESAMDFFAGMDEGYFYQASGWRLGNWAMAARAVWFRRNRPEIWEASHKYLTTIDYVNMRLTGRAAIDPTNAAMTQLFNIVSNDWDERIITVCGVPRRMLPDIVPSGKAVGTLTPEAALELGLDEDTLVVSGAHDQYAAAVGCGACEPGDLMLSTGTAWVLLGISTKLIYDYDDYLGVGNHALQNMYGVLSSISTAGVCLEWFRQNFAEMKISEGALTRVPFGEIDIAAAERVGRSPDLLFFPQFGGRGFPRWTPESKASFMGLSLEHDSIDMALSIMEGVVFDIALSIEAYAEKGFPCERLKLFGGASKSRLWVDIIRNVTGLPIARFREANVACLGAAALAASACSMIPDVRRAAEIMNKGNIEYMDAPVGELREYYAGKYNLYKKHLPTIERYYKTEK